MAVPKKKMSRSRTRQRKAKCSGNLPPRFNSALTCSLANPRFGGTYPRGVAPPITSCPCPNRIIR